MKKTLLFVMSFFIGIGTTFAYTPTTGDTQMLSSLKALIGTSTPAHLWSYYQQFSDFVTYLHGESDQLDYLLPYLRDYSLTQFSNQKIAAKQESKKIKADFLAKYHSGIILDLPLSENCIGWYNSLDNLSFANDFPTALTIAIWYRESNCLYGLPKNGNGPFQIISKNYGTGEITEQAFRAMVQDFLTFSKNKINRYNTRNAESDQITLSYTQVTFKDLLKFAALYNGLQSGNIYGEIAPAAPKYFYEGYESEAWTGKHTRMGIFGEYLKALERELDNQY